MGTIKTTFTEGLGWEEQQTLSKKPFTVCFSSFPKWIFRSQKKQREPIKGKNVTMTQLLLWDKARTAQLWQREKEERLTTQWLRDKL